MDGCSSVHWFEKVNWYIVLLSANVAVHQSVCDFRCRAAVGSVRSTWSSCWLMRCSQCLRGVGGSTATRLMSGTLSEQAVPQGETVPDSKRCLIQSGV